MQQAARASRQDRVPEHGRGPGRLRRRAGRDDRHLHQPAAPDDRGLRVRSVRLSRGRSDDMTDPRPRRGDAPSTRQLDAIVHAAEARSCRRPASRPGARPSTARSSSSRTPSCAWARSSRTPSATRAGRSSTHDAELALRIIEGDAIINEAQRSRHPAHLGDDRDPEPGRPRPALPADPRPRHVRAGADRRPRVVGRQGGPQAGPGAAAQRLRPPARDGRALRGPRPRRPARAGRRRRRSRPARSPSRTTRSTGSITRPSTRSSS